MALTQLGLLKARVRRAVMMKHVTEHSHVEGLAACRADVKVLSLIRRLATDASCWTAI